MRLLLIRNWTSLTYLLFSFACLSVDTAFSQTLEDILVSLQLDEEEDILTSDEFLMLEDLIRRPLNLNQVTQKQLADIPLLSPADVSLIMEKRKKVAHFSSLDEVTDMPGLSLVATQLLPLVATVTEVAPLNITVRNRWVTSGDDVRLLTRAGFGKSSFSGGFLAERDPEELSLSDYISAYITYPVGNNTRIILGDHQIKAGYGLLFGRSTRPIKGYTDAGELTRLGNGLRPYRSTFEYWALRGSAVEYTNLLGRWIVSYSASPKDARLDSNRVVSLSTSGLHRTDASLVRKHNMREDVALVLWQGPVEGVGNFGAVLARDRWVVNGQQPENRKPKSYGSLFGRFFIHQLQFFGEIASHTNSQPSFLTGVMLNQETVRWVGSLRRYAISFRGPRSQPFREWGGDQFNEVGLYQAISLKVGRHRFFTYGDLYRQLASDKDPGRKVQGFETAATLSSRWRSGGLILLRWKREEKSLEDAITYVGDFVQTKEWRDAWRINSTIPVSKSMKLQLQGDRVIASRGGAPHIGYGFSCKVHLTENQWRASFNWVGYLSDDYQSRIYVWDLNLPGELRNKSFSPTGQSVGVLLKLITTTGTTLSIRTRANWEFDRDNKNWSTPRLESGFQMDVAF